ncbi:hypothetical protein OIDMADRAFT_35257 [Oidiodendron maius Zn]|uniref:Transcription factor domain-containing protein n=1 Tax=Oidiodendron maius (strain Zn) TaxID=913774 RepID=A0A0C3C5R5_OIDMZ|nr:hypothetical protein OIDMADRAFT_35257 [Oidiodendron maius Zn]
MSETQAPETTALAPPVRVTGGFAIGKGTNVSRLQFINTSLPKRTQPIERHRVIRSHAARQSHYQRELRKYGIAGWVVNADVPVAVPARADITASSTHSPVASTPLERPISLSEDPRVQNMATPQSLLAKSSSRVVHHHLKPVNTAEMAVEDRNYFPSFPDFNESNCDMPCEQSIGVGHGDPFASLPVTIETYMWPLINHYTTFIASAHFPHAATQAINPIATICLPLAIMNPHLLQAILLVASHSLHLRGACDSRQVSDFRGRTIHLINEALHDKERAMEDATFAAIAHLAVKEVSVAA